MKKYLFIAAAALAMLASCQVKEELAFNQKQDAVAEGGIHFDVYTQRGLLTRGGTPGDITNENIGNKDTLGFGVFAYYTAGEKYDANAKPNFMYNQQVYKQGDAWKYEPVKYWPNEYGNAAISDEVDYVTFFAYAPYTEFEPTTGEVVVPANSSTEKAEKIQKYNIISVNKNNATGDPIIKYVVDTDPATSVDLLFGVAAANAAGNYSAIDTTYNKANVVTPGFPFIDLMKPGNPKEDKISFNLKHSLAKVKFTIDYIKDDFTPQETAAATYDPSVINADETRIFVRSFTIGGWATKGALNLNNKDGNKAGEPLWKDFDGVKDLAFSDVTFHDGRKDGKEGDVNGIQSNEENQGLNPNIIENFSQAVAGNPVKFGATKTAGVTAEPQLLFGGNPAKNGGYFYVIPRNEKSGANVDVTIVYDVETIDGKLAGLLSDGATHGLSIENVISKRAILGEGKDFEAGKQYLIKIHIGMTSVKIDAVVTDWVPTNDEDVNLPDNQPMPCWTVKGVPGYFLSDPAKGIVIPADDITIVKDSVSFAEALKAGPFQNYYNWCDTTTGFDHSQAKYHLAGADRFNYTDWKSDMQSGLGVKTAAQWEAAKYVRTWRGALVDASLKSSLTAKFPQFGFIPQDYPLGDDATSYYTISYNGGNEVTLYTGAQLAAKNARGYEPFLIGAFAGELNNSEMAFDVNGDATTAIEASKFVVKRYFTDTDNITYHETIQ